MRALAEEAGNLDSVGPTTIPHAMLSGGVQAILRRRLSHVPPWARPLLKLAAVKGRQIELDVLSWLANSQGVDDVEAWVIDTANAAVGEVQGELWRFAHDKLRQTTLADLAVGERQQLHQHVAVSIETFYSNPVLHAEELLYHWHEAGDASREVKYLIMAAERAVKVTALFDLALDLLRRALEILETKPDDPRRGSVFNLMGRIYFFLGQQEEARAYLKKALELGYPEIEAAARIALAEVEIRASHLDRANSNARLGLAYFRKTDNKSGVADALQIMAQTALETGAYAKAGIYLIEALVLRTATNDQQGLGMCHNLLGTVNLHQGMYDEARLHYDASLRIRRALGDIRGMSSTFNDLALLAQGMADYEAAWRYQEQSLALRRRIHDRHGIEVSLGNLSHLAQLRGDLDLTEQLCEEALLLQREIGDKRGMGKAFADLAVVAMNKNQDTLAQSYFEQSQSIKLEIADRPGEAIYCLNYGVYQLVHGETRAAAALFAQAQQIARELGEPYLEACALFHAGEAAEVDGCLDDALGLLLRARTIFVTKKLPREIANTQIALARVWAAQSNFDAVFETLHEATAIVTQLNVPSAKLRLLTAAAYVDWRLGKISAASSCLGLIAKEKITERIDQFYFDRIRAEIDPTIRGLRLQPENGQSSTIDAEIARIQADAATLTDDLRDRTAS